MRLFSLPSLKKLLNMRLFKSWHCIWMKYTGLSWRCNSIKNLLLTAERLRSYIFPILEVMFGTISWHTWLPIEQQRGLWRLITTNGYTVKSRKGGSRLEKTAEIPVKMTEIDPLFESIGYIYFLICFRLWLIG